MKIIKYYANILRKYMARWKEETYYWKDKWGHIVSPNTLGMLKKEDRSHFSAKKDISCLEQQRY